MLDSAWAFVRRHQRKLVITAGVAGGLYYSGKLLLGRISEMQAASAKERAAKDGIRRRFDQNQRDCLFTIMSLLPELSEQVLHEVDVERLIAELRAIHTPAQRMSASPSNVWSGDEQQQQQQHSQNKHHTPKSGSGEEGEDGESNGSSSSRQNSENTSDKETAHTIDVPRRTKVEIWEDIKVQSFARTLIAVYSESLLTMLVHVQLSMVGRSTYLDSVVGKYAGDEVALEGRLVSRLSSADEQNFLMLAWWFINRGWRQLMALVLDATNHCIGHLPLKERVSHRELSGLFSSIHNRLRDNGLIQTLPSILLPLGDANVGEYLAANRLEAEHVFTPVFVRLLDQIRDIIESTDFTYVLGCCVDRLTAQLLESLQESFPEPVPAPAPCAPLPPTVEGEAAPNLEDVVREFEHFSVAPESRVVIVQLLPRIAREGHQILNGVPNQYLENVSASREVQALSAAVYTADDFSA
ncbi:peroxin [Coemansia erecta]|uniref:Peroxin n=1 Tax=Coemansia erecta TaxID=147472 RepID=A0A9W8CQI2_9FUNG|nr:peroxin [Coemansia erecta]